MTSFRRFNSSLNSVLWQTVARQCIIDLVARRQLGSIVGISLCDLGALRASAVTPTPNIQRRGGEDAEIAQRDRTLVSVREMHSTRR